MAALSYADQAVLYYHPNSPAVSGLSSVSEFSLSSFARSTYVWTRETVANFTRPGTDRYDEAFIKLTTFKTSEKTKSEALRSYSNAAGTVDKDDLEIQCFGRLAVSAQNESGEDM